MIFGGIWERNKKGRNRSRRDLGKRRSARTRDDSVGCGHALPHLILITEELPALRLVLGKGKRLSDAVKFLRARDMNHIQVGIREQLVLHANQCLIDMARA